MILPELDTSNWEEAFKYAHDQSTISLVVPDWKFGWAKEPFDREDVRKIIALDEGENDGAEWVIVGQLRNGYYFSLFAWCDYTGWDCQAGGEAFIATSRNHILTYGLTDKHRERLGFDG